MRWPWQRRFHSSDEGQVATSQPVAGIVHTQYSTPEEGLSLAPLNLGQSEHSTWVMVYALVEEGRACGKGFDTTVLVLPEKKIIFDFEFTARRTIIWRGCVVKKGDDAVFHLSFSLHEHSEEKLPGDSAAEEHGEGRLTLTGNRKIVL